MENVLPLTHLKEKKKSDCYPERLKLCAGLLFSRIKSFNLYFVHCNYTKGCLYGSILKVLLCSHPLHEELHVEMHLNALQYQSLYNMLAILP